MMSALVNKAGEDFNGKFLCEYWIRLRNVDFILCNEKTKFEFTNCTLMPIGMRKYFLVGMRPDQLI